MNKNSKIIAWLRLMRIPNLFTVPGEAVVGYIFCRGDLSKPEFIYLIAASLCFYILGLITNDIADVKEDRNSSPGRPIPSGKVSVKSASAIAILFFMLSFIFTLLINSKTFTIGLALSGTIITYNFFSARGRVFPGPFLLSLCRVLNIMLGVAAAGTYLARPIMLAGFLIFEILYIFGLSVAASEETSPKKAKLIASSVIIYASMCILLFSSFLSVERVIAYSGEVPPPVKLGLFFWIVAFFFVLKSTSGWYAAKKSENVPRDIGMLIRNLIVVQASVCAFSGCLYPAIFIILLFFPAYFSSKYFYGS